MFGIVGTVCIICIICIFTIVCCIICSQSCKFFFVRPWLENGLCNIIEYFVYLCLCFVYFKASNLYMCYNCSVTCLSVFMQTS